jgi:hypothetical protein
MNTRNLTILASSLALVGAISGCGPRSTDASKNAPSPAVTAEAPKAEAPKAGAPAEAETPMQIPAGGADVIWQAVDKKNAELQTAIQSGSLGEVHHMAFAIRDLVAALPERSNSLSADQQTKVQASVKFVATLADRLDASGDANDKTGAQDNYGKLAGVLKDLRANYPDATPK